MITAAALALGALIGLSLGALGGGGSILTVPALVYVLGETARLATAESLVVVGLTALGAAIAHARARHVRWGPGITFGLAGLAASYAGSAVNTRLNPQLLLIAFAALMLVAAVAMVARRSARTGTDEAADPADIPDAAAPLLERGGALALATRPAQLTRTRTIRSAGSVKILIAGSAVGFLTGLLGVGGGFVIVPVLVTVLGYTMADAVGTSLLVIAINSAAALLARTGHLQLHWTLLGPFTAAALVGAFAGHRVADRLPAQALRKAFAVLLVLVAGYVAVRAGPALAG